VNAIINVSGNRLTSEQLARLREAVAAYREVWDRAPFYEQDEVVEAAGAVSSLRKTLTALGLTAVPPELWDGEAP
jgi:hypothetical protein